MFEGDKEKYKKFLKNLENALAEADIQKKNTGDCGGY